MVTKEEREKVYEDALELWGDRTQTIMVIEEMSELTKALTKDLRYGKKGIIPYPVVEETADCLIMLEQLIVLYNMDDIVKEVMQQKIKRLKKTIKKESKKGYSIMEGMILQSQGEADD